MTEILFDIANIMARRGQTLAITRGANGAPFNVQAIVAPVGLGFSRETASGASGTPGRGNVVLIGYRSYPGQTDLNVQRGDLFKIGATQYRCTYVEDAIPFRREAYAESTQG